jgi:hypothetical protein
VSDEGIALRAGSGYEPSEGHVDRRCEQCLRKRSLSQQQQERKSSIGHRLPERLTGATSSKIAWMIYGPRVQFGDSLPDMMRPMKPMISTGQRELVDRELGSMDWWSELTQASGNQWNCDNASQADCLPAMEGGSRQEEEDEHSRCCDRRVVVVERVAPSVLSGDDSHGRIP